MALAGALDPHAAQVAEVVQHQRPHLGRLAGQPRAGHGAAGQESIEDGCRGDPQLDRAPGQGPGFQPHLAVPLQAKAQPSGRDLAEVGRVAARLVRALRDPRVGSGVPYLSLPPRARVISSGQQPPAAAELLAQVAEAAGPGKGTGPPPHRQRELLLPFARRQAGQRSGRGRAEIADHLAEAAHQRPHVGDVDLAALGDDAEHAPRQLLADHRRQRRQVNARRPPALMSQPAAVLPGHGARAETGQAHAGRDRLPEVLQEPGLIAGVPVRPGAGRPAAHAQSPAPALSGEAASHLAVSAFQSAAARSSASSVT